jgi:hypothetical protein
MCRFMRAYEIDRKLARTVAWSTAMATATYGIEVMYESQQWIIDQIQKVNVNIAKDIAGVKSTTVGCDVIRSADTQPTRVMLDRRTERHVMRLLTQKNSNSDLIPHELDGMVDKEDIQLLIVGPSAQLKICGYWEMKLSSLSLLALSSRHGMKKSS